METNENNKLEYQKIKYLQDKDGNVKKTVIKKIMKLKAECKDCNFKRYGITIINGKVEENNNPFYQVVQHISKHPSHVLWLLSSKIEYIDGFPMEQLNTEYIIGNDTFENLQIKRYE